MTESQQGRRYRLLAIKALQTAARVEDAAIRATYQDIAAQYETLALGVDSHEKAKKDLQRASQYGTLNSEGVPPASPDQGTSAP